MSTSLWRFSIDIRDRRRVLLLLLLLSEEPCCCDDRRLAGEELIPDIRLLDWALYLRLYTEEEVSAVGGRAKLSIASGTSLSSSANNSSWSARISSAISIRCGEVALHRREPSQEGEFLGVLFIVTSIDLQIWKVAVSRLCRGEKFCLLVFSVAYIIRGFFFVRRPPLSPRCCRSLIDAFSRIQGIYVLWSEKRVTMI